MTCQRARVLIVDDEQLVCDLLYDELSEWSYLCTIAFDGDDALTRLATQDFNVALLDIKLPGTSGIEVLKKVRSDYPNTAAIMITAINDVDTAVEAMKLGASDYIVKPFDLDNINSSIRTALQTKKCLMEKRRDHKTPLYLAGEEEDKPATEESFAEMDAIACGVEARHDLLFGHSKIVTQETIDIAQRLGIPEKEIQRWAGRMSRHDTERSAAIKSSLNKLERSPLAQRIMGIAMPYLCRPKPDESQN